MLSVDLHAVQSKHTDAVLSRFGFTGQRANIATERTCPTINNIFMSLADYFSLLLLHQVLNGTYNRFNTAKLPYFRINETGINDCSRHKCWSGKMEARSHWEPLEQKIYNGQHKWLPAAAATGPADQQIPLARRPDLEMNVIRRLHLDRSAPVPLMQPHHQQDADESKQFHSCGDSILVSELTIGPVGDMGHLVISKSFAL